MQISDSILTKTDDQTLIYSPQPRIDTYACIRISFKPYSLLLKQLMIIRQGVPMN